MFFFIFYQTSDEDYAIIYLSNLSRMPESAAAAGCSSRSVKHEERAAYRVSVLSVRSVV